MLVDKAMKLLDCSNDTIYRLLRSGEIEAEKKYLEDNKGGRKPWVIDDNSFHEYYKMQKEEDNIDEKTKKRIYVDYIKNNFSYTQIALKYEIKKNKVVEIIYNFQKKVGEKEVNYLYSSKCEKCDWSKEVGSRKGIERYVCLFPYCISRNK